MCVYSCILHEGYGHKKDEISSYIFNFRVSNKNINEDYAVTGKKPGNRL